MKHVKLITFFFTLLFVALACATGSLKSEGKYDLEDQLEPVSEIIRYNLMGWEAVDNQSLILQTAPSKNYLIVLRRPAENLMYSESISISHTGDMVKPGFDEVTVFSSPFSDNYVIDKIYKLENRDQINAIRKQLTGK